MVINKLKYKILVLVVLVVALTSSGFIFYFIHFKHNIKLSDERELKITLESGFGNLKVSRGKSLSIVDAEIESERNLNVDDCFDYENKEGIGYLVLNTTAEIGSSSKKKHSFNFSDLKSSNWNLQFTDAIPISFDVELGMGKGDFDLSGLAVKDLNISTGASSFVLRFDKPNQQLIENLTIESGLCKFRGMGLCNANFERLKFDGGVGTYTLDFGGELSREADVDIQIGLGSLTVIIPEDIGVKVKYEKNFISHIELDNDFEEGEEDNYYTTNFNAVNSRLNIKIEAGLGSVKVKRE